MGEDYNNSSLNNLFGNFLNIEEEDDRTYDFNDVNNMVCIDTSNHRIGINTLDPTCSLDISGTDGKIIVNSISCKNLELNGINVNQNLTEMRASLIIDTFNNYRETFAHLILGYNNDASFTNVDISGTLNLSSNNSKLNIVDIDNSGTIGVGGLYYDASGFIKIKLNENNKIN